MSEQVVCVAHSWRSHETGRREADMPMFGMPYHVTRSFEEDGRHLLVLLEYPGGMCFNATGFRPMVDDDVEARAFRRMRQPVNA